MQYPPPVNMISVDYGSLVLEECSYLLATENVPFVSKCVAQFLDLFFETRTDVPFDHLHVIGMSLGGQVSGQIKRYLKTGKIPRITGDISLKIKYPAEVSMESKLKQYNMYLFFS